MLVWILRGIGRLVTIVLGVFLVLVIVGLRLQSGAERQRTGAPWLTPPKELEAQFGVAAGDMDALTVT